MRFGETEEEFDKRLEAYDEVWPMQNKTTQFLLDTVRIVDRTYLLLHRLFLLFIIHFLILKGNLLLAIIKNSLRRSI